MRSNRWISATLQTMIAVAPVVASLRYNTASSAADDSDAISRLVQKLNAPSNTGATVAEREEAALQLVKRDTPESRDNVRAILLNAANSNGQIAVARALAQASDPDPNLIPVLGRLLGPNKLLTDAAAADLANYRQTSAAFDQLRAFVDIPTNPAAERVAVIHAIGALVDPEPANARYLVDLSSQPNQAGVIKDAATDSLTEMTGLTINGKDPRKWQQWWVGAGGKTLDQFRAMLLETRGGQYNLMKQRNAQLVASASALLKNDYLTIPVNARDAVVLNYLNDRAPDIRIVGIELVDENFAQHPPARNVRDRLFALIGDGDDKVRVSVMTLMPTLSDSAALNPLLTQLSIEKDIKIKQLIAQALGKLGDPASVPRLLVLLQDSQPENVIAAAKAFTTMGQKLRDKDPTDADNVSGELRRIVAAQQNQPGSEDLRAACMNAMAALRDRKSFDTFMDSFKPGETSDVRRAALVGLGNLGDSRADATVAYQLGDRDRTIRLEAARALKTVATPGQDEKIFQQMNDDPDPDVRTALWEALQGLYTKEAPDQLKHWANQFDKDPDKKLITLEKLGDAMKRGSDAQATAYNEQDIADAMMAVKPPQVFEAISHLQNALGYWRGPGKGNRESGDKLETLVGQILDDKLRAQQWSDATAFAAEQITFDTVYQLTVGPRIRDKIDELKDTKPTDAQKLIDAALAMKPALGDKYVRQIQQSQVELKQKPAP